MNKTALSLIRLIIFVHFILFSQMNTKAQTLSVKSLSIQKKLASFTGQKGMNANILVGEYYLNAGMQDSALHYLWIAKTLSGSDSRNRFKILTLMIPCFSEKGITDSAEYYLGMANQIKSGQTQEDIISLEIASASLDIETSDYENALKHLFEAEKLCLKYPSPVNDLAMMKVYRIIGLVFLRQKEFNKAEKYIKTSLEKINDTRPWATIKALQNLTIVYINTDRKDEAELCLKKALTLLDTYPNSDIRNALYVNLGFLLEKKGHFKQAKNWYLKSLALSDSIQNKFFKARTLNNLASVCMSLEQWNEAKEYAKSAVDNAKKLNIYQDLYYGFGNLMLVATHNSDYKTALSYAHEHYKYSDSTTNANTKQQLRILEAKYDNEKKEKEITSLKLKESTMQSELESRKKLLLISLTGTILLLTSLFLFLNINKQKRLIAEQKNKINEEKMKILENQQQMNALQFMINGQENERTRIARDLHDSLGGHFSTMKMYLSTLLYDREDLKSIPLLSKTYELIDQTSEEARRIAHNMMPETLIKLGLIKAIQELCLSNCSPILHFSFLHYGVSLRVKDSNEIIIFRILQELVNNIIKHAHASQAIVQFVIDNERLSITVEDNGIGYEETTLPNESKMGLVAIQNRVNLLKGKIHQESQLGIGTTVLIDFSIQNLI
jgi:signal transduction histidine kinase